MANLIQEQNEHLNKSTLNTQGDVSPLNKSKNPDGSSSQKISRSMTRKKTAKITNIEYTSVNTTTLTFDPSQEAEIIKQILQIPIESNDYYLKTKTIFNSEFAAFRAALQIATSLSSGKKFIDPEFGPNKSDDLGLKAIANDSREVPAWVFQDSLIWMRPEELTTKKPKFLEGGAEAADVKQGAIGDCWFIGAMSVVAIRDDFIRGNYMHDGKYNMISNDELIKMTSGIFAPMFHWLREMGIYILRFYKEGAWRYVLIDDRLPCYKNMKKKQPTLAFAHCNSDSEYWVPLIEKAYAKLHNSYEALVSGNLNEGLSDMTGLVSTRTKIIEEIKAYDNYKLIEDLWKKLLDNSKLDCLMGCSIATTGNEEGESGHKEPELKIDGEKMGILKGHAYAITDVFELPAPESKNPRHKSHRLLRIRNPWGGELEWLGKWSDTSDKMKSNLYKIEKYIARMKDERPDYEGWDPKNADDGTFLMCFKDWRTHFTNLFYAIEFQDHISGVTIRGEWNDKNSGGFPVLKDNKKNNEGWAKNPQFSMVVDKETQDIVFSLTQPDPRTIRPTDENPKPLPLNTNILIFKTDSSDPLKSYEKIVLFNLRYEGLKPKYFTRSKAMRDNVLEIKNVPKGTYIVVPSLAEPELESKFIFSIYYSCLHSEIKINHINGDFQVEKILREKDVPHKFDDQTKFLLKLKTKDAIFKA